MRAGSENLYSEVLPPRQGPAYTLPPLAVTSGLSEEVSSSGTDDDGDGEYTPTKSRRGKKRVRSTSPGGDDSRRKSVKKTLIACDFCRGKCRCEEGCCYIFNASYVRTETTLRRSETVMHELHGSRQPPVCIPVDTETTWTGKES